MNSEYTNLWGRFGITLQATPEEVEAITFDPDGKGKTILAKLFAEGRAVLDGESYIPGASFEDYNWENGTDYDNSDAELNTDLIQGVSIKGDVDLETLSKSKNRGDAR